MDSLLLKRGAAAYSLLALIMLAVIFKICTIAQSDYSSAAGSVSTKTIILSSDRGKIYDTNGEKLVGREYTLMGAVKPTASALAALQSVVDGKTFAAIQSSIQKGYPVSLPLERDPHNDDISVFRIPVRYDSTAVHVIGYVDASGENGVSGIEKSFDGYLKENTSVLSVTYGVDAAGRVLSGEHIKVNDKNFDTKAGVMLTLDRDIQLVAERALDESGIDSGAAVVLEAKTGAIAAMVSRPQYERENIAASLNSENAPLLNKALCAYSVGSVFKPFIAAAGIESEGNTSYSAVCDGSLTLGDTEFGCYSQKGHGNMDLRTALIKSCNIFFIGFSKLINKEYLLSFCENFGFGRESVLADGISGASGTFPERDDIKTEGDYANLSFGQGLLSATPLQIAAAYAALVGDGVYRYPYLVKGTVGKDGVLTEFATRAPTKVMSEKTAQTMRGLLGDVVEYGNMDAKPFLTTAGGKTATAQSGIYVGSREICRTWFAGFFPVSDPEYVVVILKEDGKSGSVDCAPVFRRIVDEIVSLNK